MALFFFLPTQADEVSDAALLKSMEVFSMISVAARLGSKCLWRFPQSEFLISDRTSETNGETKTIP